MARNPKGKIVKPPKYLMTVAGQLFKHLGLQMYSGAVPAIAELVSNAYDAMAKNVWITIPLDRSLTEADNIVVRDDGHGMSVDGANNLYLTVGLNRRATGDTTQRFNGLPPRKVQGRKGIGKLAGFGVASRIGVRAVASHVISHFALDFEDITENQRFVAKQGYPPEVMPDDGSRAKEKHGTTITLTELTITRAVSTEQFRRGLARRLLVLDDNFKVFVNGRQITRQEIPLQFRFPEKKGSWATEDLGEGRKFTWWAGFSKGTIPEEEQRGFVVYVRGKLAQTPWLFDLSGGVHGQHGMQYLTGEVRADFLDEKVDLIATDRGTVRWEDPLAAPLKDWGQQKIKELLGRWIQRRREEKFKSPRIIELLAQAEKLPQRERKIFQSVVDKIVSIPQLDKDDEGKDIADELVEFVYNALTNRSFMDAIRKLNAASATDLAQFSEILSEWDILEAINTAHLVKGRVEIIRKFSQMIKDKVPEKPDMQDYVRSHPWLIDPKWTTLVHEQQLDKMLTERFKIKPTGLDAGNRRLDFFCLGDRYQTAYVVEAKRPNALVGKKEFDQLRDYVVYLRERLQDEADSENRRLVVKGLLIADRIKPNDRGHANIYSPAVFEIRNWKNLLTTTETLHEDFLKVTKLRAPADDPRMRDLDTDLPRRSKSKTKKKKKKAWRKRRV
jgi:hypothetical protein